MSSRFLITPTFNIFKVGKSMKGLRDKIVMGQKGGGRNRWGTKRP